MMFTITFENVLDYKLYYCPDGDYMDVLCDGVVWENYTYDEMIKITKELNEDAKRGEAYMFQELGAE